MPQYYKTPFGNGVLVGSGGNVVENVHNQFGPRKVGDTVGVNKVEGVKEELIFDITPDIVNATVGPFRPFVLPAGAVITAVYLDVEKAFALGGTSPTILIGTSGSEVTNGFVISKALAEGTASSNLTATLAGTWDNEVPLAANTTIGITLGGTTPTIGLAGKARVTVLFDRINRAPSPALPGGPVLP